MTISNSPLHDVDILRIGECTVTLSSREVQVPGARRLRRLTPKAVGVLRVLVRSNGRVVTRDELFAEVWPDTLPTNDVLTQAVTQLRKAFTADSEDGPAYIETIAKTGYRLRVAVSAVDPVERSALPAGEAPTPAPPVQSPAGRYMDVDACTDVDVAVDMEMDMDATRTRPEPPLLAPMRPRSAWRRVRRWVLLGVGLSMLLALGVMTWLLLHRDTSPSAVDAAVENGTRVIGSPQRPYRLITAGAGFETYPTLSPDGSQVAYEASEEDGGGQIKVQTSGNAPARNLVDRPDGAVDRFPNWSPDGREIAFARFSGEGRCEVLIASATGGNVRQATRCDGTELLSFDWTPDGSGLVFGSMVGAYAHRGIRVLDLASGRWRALTYAAHKDDFDYAPRISPDGRWLVFVRNPQVGDLWRMPAEGGPLEQLTDDAAEFRGWAWLGDSRQIVFGRRVDSEARLYQLDTEARTLRDLGLDDAQWPAVARATNFLAFVHRKAQFGLYKVPVKDPARAQRLFASSGRDSQPMLAPDDRQMVFASDRSGSYALWWADLQQPQSLRPIEGLRPDTRQPPAWSADSRHLLVLGRDDQGEPHVYEITPRDEQLSVVPVPVARPLQALYLDDPDRLLVIERGDDQRTRMSLYDRRDWQRLATLYGVSQARFDSERQRVVFTQLGASGLWSVDASLSPASVQQLSADKPSRWRYRAWSVAGGGRVDYLDESNQCSSGLLRIAEGGEPVSRCLDATRLSAGNGLSSSVDGNDVYVSLAVSDGADIGVMALPERPPEVFPAFINSLKIKP